MCDCANFLLIDQQIYGADFLEMSREDVGYLYPDKFVLGMKNVIQTCRKQCVEGEPELDHDAVDVDHMSTTSSSTYTTASSKLGKRSTGASTSISTSWGSVVTTAKRAN